MSETMPRYERYQAGDGAWRVWDRKLQKYVNCGRTEKGSLAWVRTWQEEWTDEAQKPRKRHPAQ